MCFLKKINGLKTAAIFLLSLPLTVDAMPYIGVHIGSSDTVLPKDDQNEKSTSFEIVGGFEMAENFAVELSYLHLGDTDYRSREWSMVGYTGSVLALVPLAETASLFARVGFYNWDVSVARKTQEGFTFSDEVAVDDGLDFLYGAGVKFGIGEGFSAIFEYRGFNFSDIDENASNVSLGVQYTFY